MEHLEQSHIHCGLHFQLILLTTCNRHRDPSQTIPEKRINFLYLPVPAVCDEWEIYASSERSRRVSAYASHPPSIICDASFSLITIRA